MPSDYQSQVDTSLGVLTYNALWGRGPGVGTTTGTFASIPITTSLTASSASQRMVISRQVQLVILYYQVKKGQKRIVTGNIYFPNAYQCHTLTDNGVMQAAIEASGTQQCVLNSLGQIASTYYQLNIVYQPLAYLYLFNHFAFTELIYMLAFILTGLITIGIGAFLYGVHRMMTRVRRPKYHGYAMLVAVVQPLMFGSLLGITPVMLGVVFVYVWFMGGEVGGSICSATPLLTPSSLCLEDILDWNSAYTLDVLRNGRKGLLLVFIGWYSVYKYTLLIVPVWSEFDVKPDSVRAAETIKKKNAKKLSLTLNQQQRINGNKDKAKIGKSSIPVRGEEEEEVKEPPSNMWAVHTWKRANIMLLAIFIVMMLITQVELSYSTPFQTNVYGFIVIFQFFYFFAEEVMFKNVCTNVMVSRSICHQSCHAILYCTVLYCTVLYCTVLYCTVLYCTVLYCTVLYCTVL